MLLRPIASKWKSDELFFNMFTHNQIQMYFIMFYYSFAMLIKLEKKASPTGFEVLRQHQASGGDV